MLGPDEVVPEEACLFLGEDKDPSGPVGEALEHRCLQDRARARHAGAGVAEVGYEVENPVQPVAHCGRQQRPSKPLSRVRMSSAINWHSRFLAFLASEG